MFELLPYENHEKLMMELLPGGNAWKSARHTAWKTDVGTSAWCLAFFLDLPLDEDEGRQPGSLALRTPFTGYSRSQNLERHWCCRCFLSSQHAICTKCVTNGFHNSCYDKHEMFDN